MVKHVLYLVHSLNDEAVLKLLSSFQLEIQFHIFNYGNSLTGKIERIASDASQNAILSNS